MRVLDLMKDYPETQVQILTVVTARNRDRIRDIGALLRKKAKPLKGFQWKLNHYKRIGRSQKEQAKLADKFLLDYGEFKDLALSVQRQFSDMRVRYSPLDHDRAYLFVFPDGTLATTVGARYEELGNILDPEVLEDENNIPVFREITDKIQQRAIYIPTKEKAGAPEFKKRDLMGEDGHKIVDELHEGLRDKLDEHMDRVSRIAVRIGRRLQQKGEDVTERDIHVLRMAGLVHDIGAREKYEKDLEEARNRINAGISRDKVEPTRRALARWANEKAPQIKSLDTSELERTLTRAYRTGDFYPLYRMYIKYSALGRDDAEDLTPREERVARNIFSHGGVSVEELGDKGIGFPDMLGLIVRYHHDYNSLHDKLSSMVLDGRMSPEKADKTRLLATVLILSDVLEQGNNHYRNTVLRGRRTETFDLTFDEFNGFIWKRFKQMEMISDTRALEALKDLFAADEGGMEDEGPLDADLSVIIRESRGEADDGARWLRDGDRRFMDELREDRTTRLYIKQDTDIVIGIEAGLLEKLGPEAVSDIKKIPFVSTVMGLKKRTKRERLKELSDRTWGTRAIAALIDEDIFQADVTSEELGSQIKKTVRDFVGKARKDITGIMDPDKGQLTPESIDRMRDISGLREIMAVLMRAMPESRSYGLNELSLRQMRIERSFHALKNGAAGVRLTDRVLDASGQHHLVHYADGDRIMEEREDDARAIMLPGLEIQQRRDKQLVSGRLDRFHDRFYITAPSGIATEAGKNEFRRRVMDLWMLNDVVPEEDVVILDHTESGYSAYDIFSDVKDHVPGITAANTGIRVIDGDLMYDKRAAEQGVLQVQLKEEASSSIDQYSVFVNLLVAGGKRWAYTVPGLEEVRGRLYIYIPQAHCVELEKEIRAYHELYVKSVLVDA
ncbi:MAG: HD domain-containing protein [Candidatus Omnitrophica bacterium]|nr:HD domain-containing protein [Candidatus Omnitrophota bacterium]